MINPQFNIGDIVKCESVFDKGVVIGYSIDMYYIPDNTSIGDIIGCYDEIIYHVISRDEEDDYPFTEYRLNKWSLELVE